MNSPEPRKRTARACDSCYRRKVDKILECVGTDTDPARSNVTLHCQNVIGVATIASLAPLIVWCSGNENRTMMIASELVISNYDVPAN